MRGTVTIPKKKYERLLKESMILNATHASRRD
jgi:hypothetical protein